MLLLFYYSLLGLQVHNQKFNLDFRKPKWINFIDEHKKMKSIWSHWWCHCCKWTSAPHFKGEVGMLGISAAASWIQMYKTSLRNFSSLIESHLAFLNILQMFPLWRNPQIHLEFVFRQNFGVDSNLNPSLWFFLPRSTSAGATQKNCNAWGLI